MQLPLHNILVILGLVYVSLGHHGHGHGDYHHSRYASLPGDAHLSIRQPGGEDLVDDPTSTTSSLLAPATCPCLPATPDTSSTSSAAPPAPSASSSTEEELAGCIGKDCTACEEGYAGFTLTIRNGEIACPNGPCPAGVVKGCSAMPSYTPPSSAFTTPSSASAAVADPGVDGTFITTPIGSMTTADSGSSALQSSTESLAPLDTSTASMVALPIVTTTIVAPGLESSTSAPQMPTAPPQGACTCVDNACECP